MTLDELERSGILTGDGGGIVFIYEDENHKTHVSYNGYPNKIANQEINYISAGLTEDACCDIYGDFQEEVDSVLDAMDENYEAEGDNAKIYMLVYVWGPKKENK